MSTFGNRWTLILAAGSGTRLQSLTADGRGRTVPKQFCSLNGGESLLEETFARARTISAERRIVTVVAAEHRPFWGELLADYDADQIVIQPTNRGTANGMLLGLSAIRARDPEALVTILPSDHFVAHEDVLRRALSRALAIAELGAADGAIYFLGIRPELADPELGYIVRGEDAPDGTSTIARFVEKPSREVAEHLRRYQALWNSFIIVARAAALIDLIAERHLPVVMAFDRLWQIPDAMGERSSALRHLYAELPPIDFSRDVVEHAGAPLKVVPVPYCGWSDLGTPRRVAECLARLESRTFIPASRHLNLAEAHARWAGATDAVLQTA